MRGERFSDEFPFSPERDTDSVRVLPGIEFMPKALVNGSAFVGFRKFTPRDPTAFPEFTGLVANLGLSYTLLGATTFGVSYVRDVNYSYETLQPYYVSDAAGVSVREALGPKFDVLVSADRAVYAYRNLQVGVPLAGQAPLDVREDTTWIYAGKPLEAAVCGLPAVVSNATGCVDAVVPESTGIIVQKGDWLALAGALCRYLSSYELRNKHGVHARRRAATMFDRTAFLEALDSFIRRAIATG